jgi:hypothetical protein
MNIKNILGNNNMVKKSKLLHMMPYTLPFFDSGIVKFEHEIFHTP